ncbi:hypothetical protein IHE45_05G148200 [Dioscorea alata]|nr:hypothetical protein IHE45_05G148200 [Dioscorea alata]KAH7682881.1 hypothetical protein IHE45_05G148200 [Dioscorea alata]KAH7682882.1 hypothetical protein IHE45_05G148200 [Dioscorea alata]KAH7682883.1 hypothetical protein IHE45_05G148200 [Dioscorea alata]KAH7682885.1 hypothetical protein IHE45_05G148200 [Dioscorea alata]
MTAEDTTDLHYWLNWRFLLCAIWVLSPMVVASLLISKYEGPDKEKRRGAVGNLYADESWRPCLKNLHPAWLLAFRVLAFFLLLPLLIVNVVVDGGGIFYYYTQWTFTLVIVYFGLGSLLSIYGIHQYHNKVGGDKVDHERVDEERGTYVAPTNEDNEQCMTKIFPIPREDNAREVAGFWGYAFQIIYQTNAGAVILTDCVFWFILYPFLSMKDHDLNFFLVGMHSINAVFLLGDTFLNSFRFPWFRISYFLIWTSLYVIFQWIVHGCVSLWWPYPFLDLSSDLAPVWYLLVAVLHIPCYALFPLIFKMKHFLLSRFFPGSYQTP